MTESNIVYIAHIREKDKKQQSLSEHLLGVAELSRKFASKIGLGDLGEILGLLHDIGKYSKTFQDYIKSAEGLLNPDEDDYIDAKGMRGRIDHSTAGAQIVWEKLSAGTPMQRKLSQILSLCLVSHNSGYNRLSYKGRNTWILWRFTKRITKKEIIGE